MVPSDLKPCTPTKTDLKAKIHIYNKYLGIFSVFDTKISRFRNKNMVS